METAHNEQPASMEPAHMSPLRTGATAAAASEGGSARNPILLHFSAVGGASSSPSLFGGSPALASALDDSGASSVQPGTADSSMWASASGGGASLLLAQSFSLLVDRASPGGAAGSGHVSGLGLSFSSEGPEGAVRAGVLAASDSPAASLVGTVASLTAQANPLPRTREEWKSRMVSFCEKLTVRPLTYAMIEDVQRQVRLLLDGRKALKSSRRNPIRKGDIVLASGDGGEDIHAQRRGVIETDNGDGSYMVKWLSPVHETARVEAHEVKLARGMQVGGAAGPQVHQRANQYLQRAVADKNASMVDELLREGADADNSDESGTPALLLAITKRCPHQIVTSLLKHGADPDLAGPTSQTPLQAAMSNNDYEVVNALLLNGCDCSKVDAAALDTCTARIAQAIRQHMATSLSEEARVALQHEGMASLIPLVVSACGLDSDIKPQLSAVNLMTYLMDQLPAPVLQQVFPASDPSTASANPAAVQSQATQQAVQGHTATDELMKVLLQLTQGEGCDALDAIYGLLRIVQCLLDKTPYHVARLRRSGMIRWVERLSNAAQTKQDVQAKLLQSKTGRIKDKHVSKLAADILANLPQASLQDLCATPDLLLACEALRQKQPSAFESLAAVLTRTQETSPHDLAACDVAGAILEALSGSEEQRPAQWDAFAAAFCPSREEEVAMATEAGASVTGQSRRSKLDCLIAPLVELIGTEEFWPIHASGELRRADGCVLHSDELQVLTTPFRLELSPRSQPSAAHQASSGMSTPLALHVEPLLRIQELERHLLRTCTPPQEYIALCHYLVGATIKERPSCHISAPLRLALVLGFEMQPGDTLTGDNKDSDATNGDVCMDGADVDLDIRRHVELDIRTRAPCLTMSTEATGPVVTCQSKGSPAGTVQSSRPFSKIIDGHLAYYEAAIRKRGPNGAIGVGLARAGYSNSKMPGWEPTSHAWHGDDGCTFNSCGTGTPLSTPWQEGDVIGCGIDFRRSAIFFTRNGLLQPGSLRGVDTEGLLATLGFQNKGECVSVSFGPKFLYNLSTHDLSPPQIPVHRIRYLDGRNEEKSVNLLGRQYMIVEMPTVSKYQETLGCAMCHFKAQHPKHTVHSSLLGLWTWLKSLVEDAGSAQSMSCSPHSLPSEVSQKLSNLRHGPELLKAIGFEETGTAWALGHVQEPASIVKMFHDIGDVEEGECMVQGKEAEAARDQTLLIMIPDGFPAELFFEEVEEHVRQALSAADPLVAPASGHIGDQYRWPDRGYDNEESWYESLTAALTEGQSGAVARGQTRYEAETLMARLSNVVQCRLTTDATLDYTQRARDAKRFQGGSGSGLSVGDRVQVSTGDKEWKTGNLLAVEELERFMVMCDDGSVMASVPQDHVKSLRSSRWPLRSSRVPPEMQEFMMRDPRMLEPRMLEQLGLSSHLGGLFSFPQAGGLRAPTVADIRRKFSSFEIGEVNERDRPVFREGVTPPKRRLELWNNGQIPEVLESQQVDTVNLPLPPVAAVLTLPKAGGEMHKIKSAAQLQAALDKGAQGVVGVLLIDAQARPPAGHSWPRPIHSASTLVKELAQRFGQATFLRILSGTTPECLEQFGLERSGFQPTLILMLAGREQVRWEQQANIEVLWEPTPTPAAVLSRAKPPSLQVPPQDASAVPQVNLKRVVHRNEAPGLIDRAIDYWVATGRLPDAAWHALPLPAHKTVYACLQHAGGIEPKPSSHAVHFCLKLREEVGILEWVKRLKGIGLDGLKPEAAGTSIKPQAAGTSKPCKIDDTMDHRAQVGASSTRTGRDWTIPGHTVSPQVCSALDVVKLLHQKLGVRRGDKRRWQSQWLTKRLMCQLQDALAFASCCLPQWCASIPRFLPFLFSLESRQRLLDCNAFGSSHALYRFQEHKVAAYRIKHAESMRQTQQQLARARELQDIDAISRATDDLDIIEQRMYSKRIGAMASDLARVARGNILENAIRLVDLHHSSKHILEVQFHEEDGFGSGVTQNFYEAVSVALQVRSFNKLSMLWISDGRDDDCKIDPEGPFKYLINADGLFPQPLPATESPDVIAGVESQFRFIGRLMGKACRDKFTVPLPLHPHFFEMVKGTHSGSTLDVLRSFSRGRDTLLPSDDYTRQHLVGAYCVIVTEMQERSKGMDESARKALVAELEEREFMSSYLNRSYRCSLAQFLATSAASFVDPLTATALCEGGESLKLSVENLAQYVDLIATFWFDAGVRRQIVAFRAGINDVFPLTSLEVCPPLPARTHLSPFAFPQCFPPLIWGLCLDFVGRFSALRLPSTQDSGGLRGINICQCGARPNDWCELSCTC